MKADWSRQVCLGVLNSASTVALPVLPVPSPSKGGGRTRSSRQPHLIHLKKKESLKNVSLCPGPGPLLWPCACIMSLCCALSSAVSVTVSVTAGDSVTLPCDGSAHTHTVQVYWQTPGRLVCESSSGRCEARTGFEGRVEFAGAVESGDFSLTIHSTQLSDEDLYECFRVSAAGQSTFLGEVRVRVLSREESAFLSCGQPLSLRLYSRAAVTVWFNPAGAGASLPVCAVEGGTVTPDPAYGPRVSGQEQEVTLSALTFTDQGSYTVLDSQSRATISTVNVTVTAHRDSLTLRSGAALSLRLFTAEPVEVLFAAAGEGASVSVCAVERGAASRPGPGYEHRVSVQSGSLTLRSLTAADQGNYTVRESGTNRTISSVSVSVSEEAAGFPGWPVALIVTLIITVIAAIAWWRIYPYCRGQNNPGAQRAAQTGGAAISGSVRYSHAQDPAEDPQQTAAAPDSNNSPDSNDIEGDPGQGHAHPAGYQPVPDQAKEGPDTFKFSLSDGSPPCRGGKALCSNDPLLVDFGTSRLIGSPPGAAPEHYNSRSDGTNA
ncbi:uncharacterized protein LOC136771854 [Amia ocellicauda]|uniref:uncharacterized protein LOC136771854 n=1 Tax=Amia ocellicauda TaxID=2972642 RepID=UPI0034639764